MTFEELRKVGVPGVTVLENYKLDARYIGWDGVDSVVVKSLSGNKRYATLSEVDLENWNIKTSEPDKLYLWAVKNRDGVWQGTDFFYTEKDIKIKLNCYVEYRKLMELPSE